MVRGASSANGSSVAVVLAGGGAFGAYEAGVLEYVLGTLSKDPAFRHAGPRFDIACGTSVGALNASHVGASAREPARGAEQLGAFWRSLTFNEVLRFGLQELSAAVALMLGTRPGQPATAKGLSPRPRALAHQPVAGLFDTSPLRRAITRIVPWASLTDNIAQGLMRGVAVCATEICTGLSVIFYETAQSTTYRPGRDPTKLTKWVRLGPEHAMASAAIPFVFPAVQINGVCYTDGALRQNTPLNPALRMGADRVLVVSVSQDPAVASCKARVGCRRNPYPGGLFLLGKTVGILLSQSLDYELGRIEMYNKLLTSGAQIYGPGFAAELNAMVGDHRNATYRPVKTCHIRPTENPHELALEALEHAPHEIDLPGAPGKVLGRLMRSAMFAESELLGTMMFTPTFVRALADLGYRDAQAKRAELVEFFAP